MFIRRMLKFCSAMLCIMLVLPILSLSAGAVDEVSSEKASVITDTLRVVMESNTEETTRVAIWLSDIDTEEALATASMPDAQARLAYVRSVEENSKETNEIDRSIEIKRAALRYCYEAYTTDIGLDYLTDDEIVYCSEYLPIVIADLSDDRIEQLASVDAVDSIDYYCDEVVEAPEVEMTEEEISAATRSVVSGGETYYTPAENASYIGATAVWNAVKNKSSNVKIGVLEQGRPDIRTAHFGNNHNIIIRRESDPKRTHATLVAEIIHAMIPKATTYCTTYYDSGNTLIGEMDWFMARGVHVINISLELKSSNTSSYQEDSLNSYGTIAHLLDLYVRNYNVTIVEAAGNRGGESSAGIVSGGMAYNIITVGNYNRGTGMIASHSSYNQTNNYANKPDISAPGYVKFSSWTCLAEGCTSSTCYNGTCDYGNCCNVSEFSDSPAVCCERRSYDRGTSFAAPLVTATVAILMWKDTSLKNKPEAVKALLAATVAMDISHHYIPTQTNFKYYGAGIINAGNASDALTATQYVCDSITTASNGSKSYSITLASGQKARIALSFDYLGTNGNLDYDIDLSIYNASGSLITTSSSARNTLEIIEFTPSGSSTNYTVKVTVYSGSSSQTVPYAISWSQ